MARTAAKPGASGRREQLVGAAFELIAAKGLEGLRLRDVAAAVGLDQSTLHYYFPTKEDLIRLVVEYATKELWPTIGTSGGPAEQIREHLRLMASMMTRRPAVFVVLAELNLRGMRDPAVRAIIDEHDGGWRASLAPRIAEATWPVHLEPDSGAELIIAAIKGATFHPAAAEALLDHLARLLTGPTSDR